MLDHLSSIDTNKYYLLVEMNLHGFSRFFSIKDLSQILELFY